MSLEIIGILLVITCKDETNMIHSDIQRKMLMVGSYEPETDDKPAIINREHYRQGWIFKDEDAFLNHPDKVCYIPELSDTTYTRNSIVEMLNGDEELAQEMFYELDWQHPESLLEDWIRCDEITYCETCEKYIQTGGEKLKICPVCGTELED